MPYRGILLVEDNPDHEVLTLRAIRRHRVGEEVHVVRDGAEALEYLFAEGEYQARDRNDLPRLILLDLQLPKLDGHEVLRRLRSNGHTRIVPVVVLTSSDEESDMLTSYDLGANSYVRKPVDFVRFVDALGNIGHYWLSLNEVPTRR